MFEWASEWLTDAKWAIFKLPMAREEATFWWNDHVSFVVDQHAGGWIFTMLSPKTTVHE
jgi:hypothetical protein